MDEWPIICISTKHYGSPRLATGYFQSTHGYRYPYCQNCSRRLGIDLKKYGYKWVQFSTNQHTQQERVN